VGRVWPRPGHRGRPLNSVVRVQRNDHHGFETLSRDHRACGEGWWLAAESRGRAVRAWPAATGVGAALVAVASHRASAVGAIQVARWPVPAGGSGSRVAEP